jgi:argininosuccinate lyase
MRAAASADFSTATDLADHLAQRGVPFRTAHRVVGELVRYCQAQGRELPELTLDELRQHHAAFEPDAVGITAERSVAARRSLGGTAPEQVRAALEQAAAAVQASAAWVAERRATHPTVGALLALPWDDLRAPADGAGRGTPSPAPANLDLHSPIR